MDRRTYDNSIKLINNNLEHVIKRFKIGKCSGKRYCFRCTIRVLSDVGRLAEFTVLLSQKGQTNRIANAQTTMTAVVSI
jgi:hypothetical protein